MNNPSHDISVLQDKSNQNRIEFLRLEMELCFTFTELAETERQMSEDAERTIANAEKAYATVRRFLSDPKHAKHVSYEQHRDFTYRMTLLREKLDDLKR